MVSNGTEFHVVPCNERWQIAADGQIENERTYDDDQFSPPKR